MRIRLGTRVTVYALIGVSVLIVVFPLLWMLASALKTNGEIIDPKAQPRVPRDREVRHIRDTQVDAPCTKDHGILIMGLWPQAQDIAIKGSGFGDVTGADNDDGCGIFED